MVSAEMTGLAMVLSLDTQEPVQRKCPALGLNGFANAKIAAIATAPCLRAVELQRVLARDSAGRKRLGATATRHVRDMATAAAIMKKFVSVEEPQREAQGERKEQGDVPTP